MAQEYSFGTIEFRNGVYQGYSIRSQPHGLGILLDDQLRLFCSTWTAGKLNSETAIILGHSKYIYGQHLNNRMNGFNVFRSGETVLLGNLDSGSLRGQFIVVFEKNNFVAVGYFSKEGLMVVDRVHFKTDEELRRIVDQKLQNPNLDKYFSFVNFLSLGFCFDKGPLEINFDQGLYHFGFKQGLGVVFAEDNFIHRMGCIDSHWRMGGIGVENGPTIKVGNFQNDTTLKYSEGDFPTKDVAKLLRSEHKRSLHFRNDYLLTDINPALGYLQGVLIELVERLSSNTSGGENKSIKEDLKRSLNYQPNLVGRASKNGRIMDMREELFRSINRPNEIKPTERETEILNKYPDSMKKLLFSNPSLTEHSPINQSSRKAFIEDNNLIDYSKYIDPLIPSPSPRESVNILDSRIGSPRRDSPQPKPKQSDSPAQSPHKHSIRGSFKEPAAFDKFRPVSNPNEYHTNKRVEELIQQYKNPEHRIDSPFKKHLIYDEIIKSPKREAEKKKEAEKKPLKRKSPPIKVKSPRKEIKQEQRPDRSSRSYLTMYRNSSSDKLTQQEKSKSPSRRPASPLKSIHNSSHRQSRNDIDSSSHLKSVYTKYYDKYSPGLSSGTSECRVKKYNYVNNI